MHNAFRGVYSTTLNRTVVELWATILYDLAIIDASFLSLGQQHFNNISLMCYRIYPAK